MGYENNKWENLDILYRDWGIEDKEAYSFFKENNIDVSKCNDFDFLTKQLKKKEIEENDILNVKNQRILVFAIKVTKLKMEI